MQDLLPPATNHRSINKGPAAVLNETALNPFRNRHLPHLGRLLPQDIPTLRLTGGNTTFRVQALASLSSKMVMEPGSAVIAVMCRTNIEHLAPFGDRHRIMHLRTLASSINIWQYVEATTRGCHRNHTRARDPPRECTKAHPRDSPTLLTPRSLHHLMGANSTTHPNRHHIPAGGLKAKAGRRRCSPADPITHTEG